MSPLKWLARVIVQRAGSSGDAARIQELRRDVAAARRTLDSLSERVVALQRQAARLQALKLAEQDAPLRMDLLEQLLDFDRVAQHARDAVANAEIVESPIPCLVIDRLLPPAIFESVLAAIPEEAFFEETRGRARELRIPPLLSPVSTLATWQFITRIMSDAVVPAVAARCVGWMEPSERLEATRGRIIRIGPGDEQPVHRPGADNSATLVLYLCSTNDEDTPGSLLSAQHNASYEIPFVPNRAICVRSASGGHQLGIPVRTGSPAPYRVIYELRWR